MRKVTVIMIVLAASVVAAAVVAGCGSDSTVGAPRGAEDRKGADRFIGSWQLPDATAPVVTIDKVGDTFEVRVVSASGNQLYPAATARAAGSTLAFDVDSHGEVRLRLRDADQVALTGAGVSSVWHVANVKMRRFSYGP